jgi:glycosyltransferase involved in cell wall biosynthesis
MPRVLIFYHYFFPDDVVSATHISELAEGLVKRGWEVTVMPCNRGCRDESRRYPHRDEWNGVRIRRVWRPKIPQASSLGRLVNAVWMIVRWSLAALSPRAAPDVIIIGTDPVLSVLVARFWNLFRPKTRVVHWCFDLYPEAAVADGMLKANGAAQRWIRRMLRPAYRACDLIADLGPCMRARLTAYAPAAKFVTLTPWALAEPDAPLQPDPQERRNLFGDAGLALMYSGNFGRAHSYEEILQFARALRGASVRLVFSVRGNREEALRKAVADDDRNVSFCGFASADRLERRLGAADIHVVSLHHEWTGMVVPSKFFGAIAAGRPVLFAGSGDSAVAKWIEGYRLGWVLNADNVAQITEQLASHMNHPEERSAMRRHCYDIYHEHFAKERVIDCFDQALRLLTNR